MEEQDFRVGGEDEGYVLRDASGVAFYPGYYLHGVYHARNGMNAWTGEDGERIRRELNQRLGEELIRMGPHDNWDQRSATGQLAGPRGPKPPVLFFLPDGNVEVRHDARSMELYCRYLNIPWWTLYPDVPEPLEEAPA